MHTFCEPGLKVDYSQKGLSKSLSCTSDLLGQKIDSYPGLLIGWVRSWKENLRKLARLSQTTQILSLYFCKQSEILALSDTIWPVANFPEVYCKLLL